MFLNGDISEIVIENVIVNLKENSTFINPLLTISNNS